MSRISSKTIFLGIVGLASFAYAKSGWGEACSQANSHLDSDTWALDSDCDATTYCADNSTCAYRGCRKDIYPFGYNGVAFDQLPALCPLGQFCPDEGDRCLDQVPVGGSCQKDRDDECAPSPDWNDLNGYLNVNGTVCLNFVCQYANVTLGLQCILENTPYTGYLDSGAQYAFVISRDNCANGLYCDGTAMQCMKDKAFGAACTGNKECLSYNCGSDHKCGRAADEPIHPGTYAYVLVGLGITILILSVMISLWFVHRRSRKENQIKLEQYYNEQIAYRQSIMSMSHAKNSLLSLPPNTVSLSTD
ncbi:hypothetical protein TREMEDRAFT_27793 [Tremella mesenterica DSM 1558]|uniref:uncharacterized protein n=1 Tax=Tremella mesenterica (strain ATCC 24925 / CBS 8224 / DSM 1558 / NBRC 9311 / NRRL Y-6157 / RJB 2259-6 / UBC 559-6) TaxID=578456 RepID=UPI0003F4A147|nr:uncharacterized protein TREMEDRAFT_27793 [Tremella mesenterica DSM 1558]EIW71414.1 hypothetical protein TREMEDRAFT_27793 [Tremella mesenterica DSM 1558]